MSRELEGLTFVDYRGQEHVLGRTRSAYAIWRIDEGGTPVRLYPLSEEGWAEAWSTFRGLEDVSASAPWTAGDADALQPMLAGQIVGRSFRLWGRNFWTLTGITAVLLIPASALLLLLNLATLRTVEQTVAGETLRVPQTPPWVGVVGNIAQSIITAVLTGAVVFAVAWFLLGRRPSIGTSYAMAIRRGASLVWVVLLAAFAVLAPLVPGLAILLSATPSDPGFSLAGFLLLLGGGVAAVFVVVRLLFAPVIVVVEGARGITALQRSWRLAGGFGWRILGVLLLIGLMIGAASLLGFLLMTPILIGGDLTEETFRAFFIAVFVLSASLGVVANPLIQVATVVLYLDARVRKEAFTLTDLERSLPERG